MVISRNQITYSKRRQTTDRRDTAAGSATPGPSARRFGPLDANSPNPTGLIESFYKIIAAENPLLHGIYDVAQGTREKGDLRYCWRCCQSSDSEILLGISSPCPDIAEEGKQADRSTTRNQADTMFKILFFLSITALVIVHGLPVFGDSPEKGFSYEASYVPEGTFTILERTNNMPPMVDSNESTDYADSLSQSR
ncbi:hypothetical protein AAG570_006550 [Ranatra chinensis]|uniref:Uncharacterized protein n=1 Tax=Ranatra chinensis TaxID=642074 RepID=A0ABD0ZFL4_9HEMI